MKTIFALILSLFSLNAFAYIPPASFIVDEAEKAHEGIKSVVMEGKITDLRNQAVLKEVLRMDFNSGRMDANYSTDAGPEGGFESHIKDIHRLGKFWLNLGIDPNAVRFRMALQELNIPAGDKIDVKLERSGSSVAYSWGKDPAVQFLKDEFLPFSYSMGGDNGDAIFIKEYTSSSSFTRVPKTVVIKIQGKETYRFDVKTVKINQKLSFTQPITPTHSSLAKEWVALVR